MGVKYEINWVLKLKPEEGLALKLEEGRMYNFHKKELRIYSIDAGIDLVNPDWEVLAQVEIKELTLHANETMGIYEITKVYSKIEREILTKLAKENSEKLKEKGHVTK